MLSMRSFLRLAHYWGHLDSRDRIESVRLPETSTLMWAMGKIICAPDHEQNISVNVWMDPYRFGHENPSTPIIREA